MEEQFWRTRWETGKIAFHEGVPNRFLVNHFHDLGLAAHAHVFVPLCGKTRDLDWLLERGYRVTGIEFNQNAVEDVFKRLSLIPEVAHLSGLIRFSGGRLTLWKGDFFSLQESDLGVVDAVYDRAALVALPGDLRCAYARRLPQLTQGAPQLLISYDDDQNQTSGPPFSVPERTINHLYTSQFDIRLLESLEISGPLAARCKGKEQVWRLIAVLQSGVLPVWDAQIKNTFWWLKKQGWCANRQYQKFRRAKVDVLRNLMLKFLTCVVLLLQPGRASTRSASHFCSWL